jgi:ribosomal protein L29
VSKLNERRKQIREYNLGEAEQELGRLRRQLFDLRIQQQRGEVKNNRQFTQVRTDIGRLMYQIHVLNRAALEDAYAQEAEELEEEEAEEVEEKAAEVEEAEAEEVEAEADQASEAQEQPSAKETETEEQTGTTKRGRKSKAKEEA